MFQEIIDWSNLNPGPLSIILTVVVIIIGWFTGFLKFIFNRLFRKDSPYIKAGGNISAGGDITVGNKKIQQTIKGNSNQQAGRDIINHLPQKNKPILDLDRNMVVSGGPTGNCIRFEIVNIGDSTAIDIKYYFSYNYNEIDRSTEIYVASNKLIPKEKTHTIEFQYRDDDIFKKEVKNLKINFKYKDTENKIYHSGRNLTQEKRADGNFNINGSLQSFFIE
ncbi:hypothetical protein C0580_01085 [Candidatus Parcubacteria bacterium]|nr:MAG: hypothetical protein C0580_01085 [Candidatus Parcubacteria bacterium]